MCRRPLVRGIHEKPGSVRSPFYQTDSRRIEAHVPQLRFAENSNYQGMLIARWRPLCGTCRVERHARVESGGIQNIDTEGDCRCPIGGLDELLKRGKQMLCPACRLSKLLEIHQSIERQRVIEIDRHGPICFSCHGTGNLTSTWVCLGCDHIYGAAAVYQTELGGHN